MTLDNKINCFDIYKVLNELSQTNPVFHNEKCFQLSLAYMLGKIYPNLKIEFEYRTSFDNLKKQYIDILIKDDSGLSIPIELKYKTNSFKYFINDCEFNLCNQSAEDITRYSYLYDISRIENFSRNKNNFFVGYVIMLTNQSRVWKNSSNNDVTFKDFLFPDGSIVNCGYKQWAKNTGEYNKSKYPAFEIKNNYQIEWKEYSNFNCKNGEFKIIVTEIQKS